MYDKDKNDMNNQLRVVARKTITEFSLGKGKDALSGFLHFPLFKVNYER